MGLGPTLGSGQARARDARRCGALEANCVMVRAAPLLDAGAESAGDGALTGAPRVAPCMGRHGATVGGPWRPRAPVMPLVAPGCLGATGRPRIACKAVAGRGRRPPQKGGDDIDPGGGGGQR